MEQYIKKSALVAEIERRKNICKKVVWDLRTQENKDYYQGKAEAYKETIDILNTIEMKDVDFEHLEQEVKDFCYKFDDRKDKWYDMTPHDKNIMISPTWSNFAMQLAKHFFVLGLKAQKL